MTYFEWLQHQVLYFDQPLEHGKLLRKLYSLAYIPIVDHDENRMLDGIFLRNEYFGEYDTDQNIIDSPCSFLEFLIGLSRRMNFIYGNVYEDRRKDCFWTLIRNMGVYDYNDEYYDSFGEDRVDKMVEEAVNRIVYRTYGVDGTGGLFPLQNPRENQRNVEVWYQMNQYLAEAMSEEGRL